MGDQPVWRIGRDPQSDIYIDDGVVSSEHAVIELTQSSDPKKAAEYTIIDLGSTNKTYVNGEAITRKVLEHDDVIRIGWNNFRFIDETKKDPNKSWIPGVYYTKDD